MIAEEDIKETGMQIILKKPASSHAHADNCVPWNWLDVGWT